MIEIKKKEFKQKLIERTYSFSLNVINMLDKAQKDAASSVIAKQLIRSATSVGANIVEAQAASSRRDFMNFINHSLKSSNESLYWLKLLKDTKKIKCEDIDLLNQEADEISRMLGASIVTMKGKRKL